ncbi:MAG: hypothetical protein LKI24_04420 [Acidipropionibacterium sp.]|jgi:hypothetical protein|nr:hypothetical protein [Acidipropionibacterium sp.]
MKKSLKFAALAAAAVVLPVILKAPPPEPALPDYTAPDGSTIQLRTIDDVVDACRASGEQGIELVDLATSLVHRMYTHYSSWHLWLTPEQSLQDGHGNSIQYNLALAQVLRRLGLTVHPVHASRVRMEHHPWYHTGHTWLQVELDGRRLDVCASRPGNRAGQVAFVPITEVRPLSRLTRADNVAALAPIVVVSLWRGWLRGRPAARWMYRPFGETA